MPVKKLYFPFKSSDVGTMHNALEWNDKTKKGFKDRKNKTDAPANYMADICGEDDRLYIVGHCNGGVDHLSKEVTCSSKDGQVKPEDLVEQLEKKGLPKETNAHIRLWACRAALSLNGKDSFASLFARKLMVKYPSCTVQAYTEYLDIQYGSHNGKPTKTASEEIPPAQRLDELIEEFNNPQFLAKNKQLKKMWDYALKLNMDDPAKAKERILADKIQTKTFLPIMTIKHLGRARTYRWKFDRDGNGTAEPE